MRVTSGCGSSQDPQRSLSSASIACTQFRGSGFLDWHSGDAGILLSGDSQIGVESLATLSPVLARSGWEGPGISVHGMSAGALLVKH